MALAKAAEAFRTISEASSDQFRLIPLTFVNKDDYATIDQGDHLEIPGTRKLMTGKEITVNVKNKTKGKEFSATFELSERDKHIILAGGSLNYIK